MRLTGKVAIVTGAGSGIGRAIAQRFASEGAAVVVAGQRRERLEQTLRPIESCGGSGRAVACDVAAVDQVRALVRTTVEQFGHLDVLVNNAARNRPAHAVAETVAELAEDWWAATLEVNATGAFYCCKYALEQMLRQHHGGCIINVASTSGIAGNSNQGAYVASKHALVGLTRSIALDYGARHIRANAIAPGFIETERSLEFSRLNRGADWRAKKLADIPAGRFGRVEEVAALAAFLASDDAAYISGAVIPIDGGTAARRGS
jgi:NAD(P)-dependent dehydrogenase (short-subunit alcohol dehydrogenase family)